MGSTVITVNPVMAEHADNVHEQLQKADRFIAVSDIASHLGLSLGTTLDALTMLREQGRAYQNPTEGWKAIPMTVRKA